MNKLIAVTSQNRKTVTGHAGRCRKFWLYPLEDAVLGERRLVELTMEETFHGTHGGLPPRLEGITTFISQGMGQGILSRLQRLEVEAWMTKESDIDAALQSYLRGDASCESEAHEHEHEHEAD
jgi:predicted Fe-Mo cluster-binding NifX family protein